MIKELDAYLKRHAAAGGAADFQAVRSEKKKVFKHTGGRTCQ